MDATHLHLKITVRNTRTVLPRCLQILSRRGFRLTTLQTHQLKHGRAELHCTLEGPARWHAAVPHILAKTVDVLSVETLQEIDHV